MSQVKALLLPLLLSFVAASSGGSSGSDLACAAADSLGRLSEFFARNADSFDADGYFGLSLASMAVKSAPLTVAARVSGACGDGALVELGRTMARIDRLLAGFGSRAGAMSPYDRVTYWQICRPMEAVLRRQLDPAVFRWRRRFEGVGNSTDAFAWLQATTEKLNEYDEDIGDSCFRGALVIKRKSRREGEKRCKISSKCRRYFLDSRPSVGYYLTHQLMYWNVVLDRACPVKLSNGRSLDRSLIDDACRRAYEEYRKILAAGPGGYYAIDLALEQAALCGLFGHRDFFIDSTTLLLRRLQDEKLGCYAGISPPTPSPSTGRKLLHDVALDGICSSHTSGLAAAYFGLSLRA